MTPYLSKMLKSHVLTKRLLIHLEYVINYSLCLSETTPSPYIELVTTKTSVEFHLKGVFRKLMKMVVPGFLRDGFNIVIVPRIKLIGGE